MVKKTKQNINKTDASKLKKNQKKFLNNSPKKANSTLQKQKNVIIQPPKSDYVNPTKKIYNKLVKYAEMNNNCVPMYLINEYIEEIDIDEIITLLHNDGIQIIDEETENIDNEELNEIAVLKDKTELTDLIKIYLKEIGNYELLTPEKEKECSKELQSLKKKITNHLKDIGLEVSQFDDIKKLYYQKKNDDIKNIIASAKKIKKEAINE
ncbi:MAG TPA: sigma-70 factor domain-containing protein, partial [bacterium]|nr:sigma-70 factor domain-containing protein [bacterium]